MSHGHDHGPDSGHRHGPDHGHDSSPGSDVTHLFTQEFWDERYASVERVWSGRPNPHLVELATDLVAGTALDVGSGEGADAIWLASRGWHVTGIDVSSVALARAAAHATGGGQEIAGTIEWRQADLLTWDPAPEQFDLVSAQFMHLPRPSLDLLHLRLAAAVRPGGTLLVVGHHPSDLDTTVGRWDLPDLLFTAEQVAAVLDPDDWSMISATSPERQESDPDGRPLTIHDAVVHAVRRG
ncbi:class I SAM-dependent methyltransferase [Lapillicoccus sp.]|uniref:class I SAM-dependent methyltransferase n=1 Tax=Lapillicoccus sp. TaxID=1909287 RepID=UPI003982DD37